MRGPGLLEIVFGAFLSLVLGAALAFAYLVVKPVQIVREIPKHQPAGTVYYQEGTQDPSRGQQWLRKRQLFIEGSSVNFNEDELNAWITAGTTAAAPEKAAGNGKEKGAPALSAGLLQMGVPNFRIRDGEAQIGDRGMLNLDFLGWKQPVVIQAVGRFVRQDGVFDFAIDRFYLGSFPLHKFPGLDRIVFQYILAKAQLPDDITGAWKKLTDVSIDGNTLRLTMP